MKRTYHVVITREVDPAAYVATVPYLNISTFGDSPAEAMDAAREAIALVLEHFADRNEPLPIEPANYAELRGAEFEIVATPVLDPVATGTA